MVEPDILIGIDAGTSVIKSIAFDLTGKQLAVASTPNRYKTLPDGTAVQSMDQTWADCAQTLRKLGEMISNLASRCAAISITGQGDGTWLIDKDGKPNGDAWLWLDARSASTVSRLSARAENRQRFETTGTGLNSCQQGAQLAFMQSDMPELLAGAATAFHCKDWLYYNLTDIKATDPSEASFTFGNYKTRQYEDAVIDALGLSGLSHLLPPIVDGTKTTHPLSDEAASLTGLLSGTPVSLGYIDVVCTALGAGGYTKGVDTGCSILGTTGIHLRAVSDQSVYLNEEGTGYVMVLPVPGIAGQLQSNMAATLNIDWLLNLASDLVSDLGFNASHSDMLRHVDRWIASAKPGTMLYHPYISEAGERGPFINNQASASFIGLMSSHRFPDLMRAVIEGLGMAARDCYSAMGNMPSEIRLTGGAARSTALRGILSATMNAPVRCSMREEAGAAGAAMIAAVANGIYNDMDDCVAEWVTPLLGEIEQPDAELAQTYQNLFPEYIAARRALEPVWQGLSDARETSSD